jgi:hypothetical protein
MSMGVQGVKRISLLLASAAILFASGSPGIRPRALPGDYPSHAGMSLATIGAAVIPASEAKKILGVDLHAAGYVVIEVGIFPEPGKDLDLSPSDFTLVTDPTAIAARPVDDEAIAATVDNKRNPPRTPSRPTDVYTSAGATIGHGTWTDPTTGRRTAGTVTGVETGVGVGGPPPAACGGAYCDDRQPAPFPPSASGPNRGQIEQELWQQSLPDGAVNRAVAGYLYFPKPSGKAKKAATWVLRWDNNGARVKLDLPNSGK